ncbi:hypothetical protein HDA40_000083 [Hamadaea flava]|uniref:VWA domain-containing protein n=1 Tax=Hamadaea flava TaxID=1742688 RepID=A0ABV8LQJ0_9ACTN|nr:vWA domain-containing protein [Hamadaea flava]MCP2321576.1 hypothetical protein [Hamadaea flava]
MAGRFTLGRVVLASAFALAVAVGPARVASAVVPIPAATTSVIAVKVGGDRTGDLTVGPLAGVELGLYAAAGSADPVNGSWALCTSDADGDCSFIVPDTQTGGANNGVRFFVGQVGVPVGWFENPTLRTGNGSGSNSTARPYRFPAPALAGGQTYTSASDFMISSTWSDPAASGGVWQQSRNNPRFPATCGLDVALLLDLSASVGSALPQLKAAANTIVDALTGTPSRMAIFSFDGDSPSTGTTNHPNLVPVSTDAGAAQVKNIYSGWALGKGTNWDQGLFAMAQAAPAYDVALVLTDGNPTRFGKPRSGDGSNTHFRDVENGVFSANALKAEGTRVVAVGVGKGVEGVSGLNLRALSGPTAFTGSNAAAADYFQAADYSSAAADIHDLLLTSCTGTLTVVKQLVPDENEGEDVTGATPAGPGWVFDASTTTSGVSGLPATETTTDDGTGSVNFDLDYDPGVTSADVAVTETQHDGHTLVTPGGKNAVCVNVATDAALPVTDTGGTGFSVAVASGVAVSCTVYNRPIDTDADVTVAKKWIVNGERFAHGEQPSGLTADLSLTDPGEAGATPQDWDMLRDGYTPGAAVEIAESAHVADAVHVGGTDLGKCRLAGSRITEADGAAVDHSLPYAATLAVEHAHYTVTNTVTCEGGLADTGMSAKPILWGAGSVLAGIVLLIWFRRRPLTA